MSLLATYSSRSWVSPANALTSTCVKPLLDKYLQGPVGHGEVRMSESPTIDLKTYRQKNGGLRYSCQPAQSGRYKYVQAPELRQPGEDVGAKLRQIIVG